MVSNKSFITVYGPVFFSIEMNLTRSDTLTWVKCVGECMTTTIKIITITMSTFFELNQNLFGIFDKPNVDVYGPRTPGEIGRTTRTILSCRALIQISSVNTIYKSIGIVDITGSNLKVLTSKRQMVSQLKKVMMTGDLTNGPSYKNYSPHSACKYPTVKITLATP